MSGNDTLAHKVILSTHTLYTHDCHRRTVNIFLYLINNRKKKKLNVTSNEKRR